MQPLGLGSGSGLGDQGVKMDKASSSKSSNTRTEVSAEPQNWGVNARNEKGRTVLHFACRMTSSGIVGMLLHAGADVNARDRDGYTPLHVAAGHGRHQSVKLLIEHGANAFSREQAGLTPRELAVKIRDEGIQAQETLNDASLQSKIAEASRGDMDSIIRLLTDAESKRVDVAAEETIPASAAEEPRSIARRGNFAKQMTTLQSAALGNALTVACRGDVEFVQLLLSGGAHLDFRGSDGATPLLAASDGGFANCVQLLLEHGANANASDNIGITALIAAAYNGHVECLRVLLNQGASINAISQGGVTPLIAAAEGRSGDCTQVLIQAGAQVNLKTDGGKTALIHAVSNNCVEAAEALLNAGADINATDGDGCSALHYGARGNSVECLRILLERGADETRKCRLGQTPLQEARKDSEGAKLLEESWKKLELEIAMRAEELLNEDKHEHKSSTSKKITTRLSREKKNVKNRKKKKQGAVEKADDANEELAKVIIEAEDEDKHFLAVDVASPSGTEVTMEQASPTLVRGSSSSDRSMHITSGGVQVYHGDPPAISPTMEELTIPAPFPAGEDISENPDEWTRVDGKRTMLKPSAPQPKPQGISITSGLSPLRGSSGGSSKSGEVVSPSADYFSTERKMLSGLKMFWKEDDSKDGESSTWVQAVLGRSHSGGDGLNPSKATLGRTHSGGDGFNTGSKTPFSRTHTHEDGPSPTIVTPPSEARAGDGTEKDKLIERMQRIELELEQARQAERTMMEKVKQLEILKEANSVQILELAQSLSRAHYQAETTKNEMQVRIYELEAVVSSRTEALEIAQAENAVLKLQLLRKEVPATEHEPSKVGVPAGSGMVRSASESSLHSLGCGIEPRSPLELLPFIPKAGPKTDTDNWFSLVPSPD